MRNTYDELVLLLDANERAIKEIEKLYKERYGVRPGSDKDNEYFTSRGVQIHEPEKENTQHDALSKREYQVMCMIASGKSLKEIAGELALSAKTISTVRSRIMKKMKWKNNAELTHYAIKKELVD